MYSNLSIFSSWHNIHMNDEKYQSYRCRLRENKLKSLRHFIYTMLCLECNIMKKYVCVTCMWVVIYTTLTSSVVDRQVKSESFLGCNIVVDGYIICGIILLWWVDVYRYFQVNYIQKEIISKMTDVPSGG